MAKFGFATVLFWLMTASEAFARGPGGWGPGPGGPGPGPGPAAAPEIDGPAGVAAIALLASAGIIAYNRYKKK